MSVSRSDETHSVRTDRNLTLKLEGFAWETIDEEAAREGLTTDELVAFSVLYYLADIDSGRISRQIARSPYPRSLEDRLGGDAGRSSAPLSRRPLTDPG